MKGDSNESKTAPTGVRVKTTLWSSCTNVWKLQKWLGSAKVVAKVVGGSKTGGDLQKWLGPAKVVGTCKSAWDLQKCLEAAVVIGSCKAGWGAAKVI